MAIDTAYFNYPHRSRGMDQDLYPWSNLFERPPITWPGGARVALVVAPQLEFFPFDSAGKPFRAPGALVRPYPNYWEYTQRDYGLRVGIQRIYRVLERLGVPASVGVPGAVARQFPSLAAETAAHDGWEIVAAGRDMDTIHHGGLEREAEAAIVEQTLTSLAAVGEIGPVRGWVSPARSNSFQTSELLAAAGLGYTCDWQNDDLPYRIATAAGGLWSFPLTLEYSDWLQLINYHCSEAEYVEQILDAHARLDQEAHASGGRVLALTLAPSIIGLPYRIGSLVRILESVLARDGVWAATMSDVLAALPAGYGEPSR